MAYGEPFRSAQTGDGHAQRVRAYAGSARMGETVNNQRLNVVGFLERRIMKQEEMNWEKAKRHFDTVRKQYQDLEGMPGVNTSFALRLTFDPLAKRYNAGERTEELYEEMMSVE